MIFVANFKKVKYNNASHTKYGRGEIQNMNLKELRTQLNLTQAALAKELGVTSKTISLIESGKMKLSDKLAAKIKEVYGEEPNTPVAEAVVSEAKAVVAKVEKAVEEVAGSAEKKVARKARATKKKVEAEAEKLADAAADAVLEAEKKVEKKARKVKAKAQADKPAAEMVAEAVTVPVEAAVEAAVVEKKRKKKAPAKAPAKKAPVAKKQSSATPLVILQSPFGGEITAEEILSKVGSVDTVYVRIDQNKAYWVKGEENGEVDLW